VSTRDAAGSQTQTLKTATADVTDPVVVRNLRTVIGHIDAAVAGDIDRLMGTLELGPHGRANGVLVPGWVSGGE